MSAAMKRRWCDPEYRASRLRRTPFFKGCVHGEYARSRVGAASRERWSDPQCRANYEKKFKLRDYTGERNPSARLTAAQVVAIRQRYASGERQVSLAEDFCVSQANISDIVLRRTWKNV